MSLRTKEAREAGALIDRLPPDLRVYLLDMIYRVAAVPPPRKQPDTDLPPNVIPLRRDV